MIKLLSLALLLLPYGCSNDSGSGSGASRAPAATHSAAQQATGPIQSDPQLLIHHCGPPDSNIENDYFQTGTTVSIPARTLTYGKAHLQLKYVSAGAQQWSFSTAVDTETNRALDAASLQGVLQKRLPCAVPGKKENARESEPADQRVSKAARERASKSAPDS